MNFFLKHWLIIFFIVFKVFTIECSVDEDDFWHPLKDHSALYNDFLVNVARGLQEVRQAFIQNQSIDVIEYKNQQNLPQLIVPSLDVLSGITTNDSNIDSSVNSPIQEDIIFEQKNNQKTCSSKNKNKKQYQNLLDVEEKKKQVELARRAVQRQQEAERVKKKKDFEENQKKARFQSMEEQRLRQIAMSNKKKAERLSAKKIADAKDAEEKKLLDTMIQNKNREHKIIEDRLQRYEKNKAIYLQRKGDESLKNSQEYHNLEISAQNILDLIDSVDLSSDDIQNISDTCKAEKDLRYDMFLRQLMSKQFCCVDDQFFIDAFFVLKNIIKVNEILFLKLKRIKKYEGLSVERVILHSFGNFLSEDSVIIDFFMYNVFYDVYDAEFNYIKALQNENIFISESVAHLKYMELLLQELEDIIDGNRS